MGSPLNTTGGMLASGGDYLGSDAFFPDPFCDMASLAMPENNIDALKWAEYIFHANTTYAQAMRRVASYFITKVEVMGDNVAQDEKKKYEEYLEDTFGIYEVLYNAAIDFLATGNSMLSVLLPFRRYLSCPKCYHQAPFEQVATNSRYAFRWELTGTKFLAHCPNPACRYQGEFHRVDRREGENAKLVARRWSYHEIEIVHELLYDQTRFVWKIPEDYRRQLRISTVPHFQLQYASAEVLKTVEANQHLLFGDDVIYHMKEPALAGVRNRGWGIGRTLINFRQAWYCQVLHRYNEALALDYIVPFRVIMPDVKGGADPASSDPMMGMNLGSFRGQVNQMLRRRRKDPAAWHVSPFPMQYRAMGGDATQFAPKDLLEQGFDTLLNGAGVPVDLYRGTLSLQAAPLAIRLFESQWTPLVHQLNKLLNWICNKIAQYFNWEPVTARLVKTSYADDLNMQMAKLQLMMGRQISQTSGLRPMGLDFAEEQKRLLDEERFVATEQRKIQDEMMQAEAGQAVAQMGSPGQQVLGAIQPQGGDPNAAAGTSPAQQMSAQQVPPESMPTTPEELYQKSQAIAQQLSQMPDGQRRSELTQLSKQNTTLAMLVKSQLEQLRRTDPSTGQPQGPQ